jgi:hypothetical protein
LIVRFLLVNVPTLWLGVGLVVLTVGLSALGLAITRWRVAPSRLAKYQAIRDVSTATEDRRARLLESQSQIPSTLWVVLLAGAFITITFTYFFALDSLGHQALMVSALATLIALSLLVILTLNLPYTGDVSVKPEAMHTELDSFAPTMF